MSRLFLVDDHAIVRDGLRALLEAAGHTVVGEAATLTEALAGIVACAPEIALVDLSLGARSGLELLAEIRRRKLAVRCLVLTMSAQPHDLAEALRLGALGYVLKGAHSRALLAAIERVAHGEFALDAAEAALAARLSPTDTTRADSPRTLSPRERQVLVLVARGASSAQIGTELHLSPKTIETYRSRLMTKLGLDDVPALVRWAIREGLISVEER
jgi:two-component system, NarL family, invasion response regulator UvrY